MKVGQGVIKRARHHVTQPWALVTYLAVLAAGLIGLTCAQTDVINRVQRVERTVVERLDCSTAAKCRKLLDRLLETATPRQRRELQAALPRIERRIRELRREQRRLRLVPDPPITGERGPSSPGVPVFPRPPRRPSPSPSPPPPAPSPAPSPSPSPDVPDPPAVPRPELPRPPGPIPDPNPLTEDVFDCLDQLPTLCPIALFRP